MPKTKYCKWTREELNLAINSFRKGELRLNSCARTYGVPKATLKRNLESKNKIAIEGIKFHGGVCTFSKELEVEIKSHLLKLAENAASDFKNTGIWPANRNVFGDHEYAAADNLQKEPILLDETNTVPNEVYVASAPSTSNLPVPIADLSPVPQPTVKKGKRKSKGAQKACVLTESPYKNDLEAKKQLQQVKIVKKNLSLGSSHALPSTSGISKISDETWYCILCKKNSKLDMIQCQECSKWVHAVCGKVSPLRKFYFCPYCLKLEGYE